MRDDRFLFMADLHIKARTWTNFPAVQGDAYEALKLVNARMDGRGLGDVPVVLGGDVFDSNRPSSEDVLNLQRFLEPHRNVYYIRGNHDNVIPSWVSVACPHAVALDETPPVSLNDGTYITGVSWNVSANALKERLKSLAEVLRMYSPELVYIVLHTSFSHLLGIEDCSQMSLVWLTENFDGIPANFLVGDVHVRDITEWDGGHYVHSPGSLYPLSWDRTLSPCAVSVIDVETGEIMAEDCTVRQYRTVSSLNASRTIRDIASSCMNDPLPPMVQLLNEGNDFSLPEGLRVVVQHVAAAQTADEVSSSSADSSAYTVLDAIREECQGDDNLCTMLSALCSSDDPAGTLESWLAYWNVERTQRRT